MGPNEQKQYDLFGGVPPHVVTDTSIAAAVAIAPSASVLRSRVFDAVVKTGAYGATCDEVEAVLEMRHQTASARLRELVLTGKIADVGERRRTRSGRTAVVWKVK